MMISQERQNHLAHQVIDDLWGNELIDFDEDNEEMVLRFVKLAIKDWVQDQGDIDTKVRTTISQLQRAVVEGSPEWNVLYRKYFQDEMRRKGY